MGKFLCKIYQFRDFFLAKYQFLCSWQIIKFLNDLLEFFKNLLEFFFGLSFFGLEFLSKCPKKSLIFCFLLQEKMEECSCEIAVSYLEVYNETIVDLINQSSGPLAIRDDGSNAINIPGLSIHKPSGSSLSGSYVYGIARCYTTIAMM